MQGIFEKLCGLLTAHRRKIFEEDFKAISGLQVFEKNTNGHTGATENRCTVENLWIFVENLLCHIFCPLGQYTADLQSLAEPFPATGYGRPDSPHPN